MSMDVSPSGYDDFRYHDLTRDLTRPLTSLDLTTKLYYFSSYKEVEKIAFYFWSGKSNVLEYLSSLWDLYFSNIHFSFTKSFTIFYVKFKSDTSLSNLEIFVLFKFAKNVVNIYKTNSYKIQ